MKVGQRTNKSCLPVRSDRAGVTNRRFYISLCFVLVALGLPFRALNLSILPSGSSSTKKQTAAATNEHDIGNNKLSCLSLNATKSRFYPMKFLEDQESKTFLEVALRTRDDLELQSRFIWYHHTSGDGLPCAFVYYHIHKNGGGSMAKQVPIKMDKFNSDFEKESGHENYLRLCRERMQRVFDSQQRGVILGNNEQQQISVVSFLRDPVDRFLSSLGQVLRSPKALMRKSLDPCHLSATTNGLIECVVSKMEKTSSFLNEHFAPQLFELYVGVQGLNIAVEVMDLSQLSDIIAQLGGSRDVVHENSASGLIEQYPQFRLSPDVLNREFQKRICHLYEADVMMIEATKVTRTLCTELKPF